MTPIRACGSAMALTAGLFMSASVLAQTPPAAPPEAVGQTAPAGRGARPGGPAPDALTPEQVQQLLDAFVMARAPGAVQLNDAQVSAFYQRMLKLQNLQRRHRMQRRNLLRDLMMSVNPKAPQATDDATIAAKTKALDDLETQMAQDERKALADIDEILTVRQRAHFRVFLENMERQKLDFLMKARQGGGPPAPVPGPAVGGAIKGR